jgi:ABC-2 type transport system permease protein
MYIAISVLVVYLNTANAPAPSTYEDISVNMAFIDRDGTEFSKRFREYVGSYADEVLEVEDEEHAIQDFIYDDYTRVLIIIPKGFEEAALRGEAEVSQKWSMEGVSMIAEMHETRFLTSMNALARSGMTRDEILSQMEKTAETDAEINMVGNTEQKTNRGGTVFALFSAYPVMAETILIVGTVACVFNAQMVKKRNEVSAMPMWKLNTQLMIGNLLFCVLLVAVLWITGCFVTPETAMSMTGVMMFTSMLALALSFAALASMFTSFVVKREVLSGIQTVIPLGLSFISGIFLDSSLLTDGILNIAKFFPTYYYAQSIERIGQYTEFGSTQWGEVLGSIGIILAFGAGYYVLMILITNLKRIKNKNN